MVEIMKSIRFFAITTYKILFALLNDLETEKMSLWLFWMYMIHQSEYYHVMQFTMQ